MQKIDLSGGTGGTSGQKVYTAPNGVVVTSSAPVHNLSNYYYMSYLFNNTITQNNNQTTTYWLTNSSGNQTLTFDFKTILPIFIEQINVYPRSRDDASSNYRILVSNDSVNWTEIVPWVTTSTSTPYGTKFTHNVNITQRYVRFELTQNGRWGVCLSEIEFFCRLGVNFVSPNKIEIDDSIITKIVFKHNNAVLGTINTPIVNQKYNILDYVSGLNYKDILVVEGYDSNNNLVNSLTLNVKEDFTGKQGILTTISSIDTKDWDSINSIQAVGDLSTGDLVPTLTSNTSASPIVVSASSIWNSTFDAWRVFDGNFTDSGSWATSGYTPRGWLKVDFGTSKIVNSYTIAIRSDDSNTTFSPKTWTFEGSNDGTNWTILDTRTNEINWTQGEKRQYIFNNTTPYRYYRINITANNGADHIIIAEMKLLNTIPHLSLLLSNDNKQTWYTYQNNQFIPVSNPTTDIFTQGITDLSVLPPLTKQNFLTDKLDIMVGLKSNSIDENPIFKGININYKINDYIVNEYTVQDIFTSDLVPALTSNTSASPIVVSASSIAGSSYEPWKAFDNNNVSSYFATEQVPYGWLKVDFGVPKKVNKYTITASNLSADMPNYPKSWTFEGSNDDTNWVVLDTRTNETGWIVNQKREYLFNNSIAYRYYRINIVNNNTGSRWVGFAEMELMYVLNSEFIYQSSITDDVYKFNFNIDGDNYKVFLSKDGGNTWLTYNGTDFIEGGDGNYIWEINNLSQELLMQFLPISNFRLKFEPIDSSAVLNNITINYSVKTNSISPSDAKETLLPIPPQYFRNVLQEDNTYTLKLEEGLSFDDANKDYDFYTTPTKVKLRPLDMGTVIGNKWSVVQAFEVINSHENQDYDIELKVAYNNEEAIIKDNTALLNDADLDNEKTIVEFSLTQDPFELIYPVKFRLDRNSKQVVYFKIKPTIVTEGTKTFQIRLTATPL